MRLAAEYLSPHTAHTDPEFGENKTVYLQFSGTDLPSLDEINGLIGEIGKTRKELFTVSERLRRIVG